MNRVLIIEDEIVTAEAVKEALALENISADIASVVSLGWKNLFPITMT